jgi:hypothetical protein
MESIAILTAAGLGLFLACAVPHLALRESRDEGLFRLSVAAAKRGRDRRSYR